MGVQLPPGGAEPPLLCRRSSWQGGRAGPGGGPWQRGRAEHWETREGRGSAKGRAARDTAFLPRCLGAAGVCSQHRGLKPAGASEFTQNGLQGARAGATLGAEAAAEGPALSRTVLPQQKHAVPTSETSSKSGLPGGSVGKNLPASAGDPASVPGSGGASGGGNGTHASILTWRIPRRVTVRGAPKSWTGPNDKMIADTATEHRKGQKK